MKRSQMISGSCRDWYWTLEIIIIAKSGRVWHKELSRFVLCILVPPIGYHAVCNSANVGRAWMTAAQLVATLGTNEKPYKILEGRILPSVLIENIRHTTSMLFRVVATLATTALALANPLITRQTTNTNPQIGDVLNKLSILNREIFFNIGIRAVR